MEKVNKNFTISKRKTAEMINLEMCSVQDCF